MAISAKFNFSPNKQGFSSLSSKFKNLLACMRFSCGSSSGYRLGYLVRSRAFLNGPSHVVIKSKLLSLSSNQFSGSFIFKAQIIISRLSSKIVSLVCKQGTVLLSDVSKNLGAFSRNKTSRNST